MVRFNTGNRKGLQTTMLTYPNDEGGSYKICAANMDPALFTDQGALHLIGDLQNGKADLCNDGAYLIVWQQVFGTDQYVFEAIVGLDACPLNFGMGKYRCADTPYAINYDPETIYSVGVANGANYLVVNDRTQTVQYALILEEYTTWASDQHVRSQFETLQIPLPANHPCRKRSLWHNLRWQWHKIRSAIYTWQYNLTH